MRALSSRTFCPFDSRRVSLWYLPAGLRYTTPVVGMLEITVVKGRLDAGVGRGQPDVACAVGQPERTRDTCHLLRWHVTVQVLRACRKTPLRAMGRLLASLLSLSGSYFCSSTCPDTFSPHLSANTRSRINLFRLQERRDRGPAISSVCHRRSLGLLNPYLSVFRVPMIPSVLPRSLRTVSRTASATCHVPAPLG